MRAEARGLNLGRTSWHYDGGRRAAAARPPQARRCARVSESCGESHARLFRGEPHATDASRAFAGVVSRAASRRHCPRVAPPWRHTLDEDSPADEIVSRAGDGCGVVVSSTKRRWHYHRPASQTGQGGACSRSARNRRAPPLPRPEQRRVDGSPFEASRRESSRGSRAESQPHAPRACTPPSQGEKILSARRAGQAGRRAGSGKTIPRLARGATLPSREAVRRAPPTHAAAPSVVFKF